MMPGEVIIHSVRPHLGNPEIAASYLNEEEKSRAARFHFSKDAIHWMVCRASLRQLLGQVIGLIPSEVPFVFSEYGKPALDAPFDRLHFNLSHCPDLALIAISMDGPVGIDLESLDRAVDLLECENSFCHPEEIRLLPCETNARASQLLRIWTAKEAVLKALGTGLSFPPDEIQVIFGSSMATAKSDRALEGIENQFVRFLDNPAFEGYQVALSTFGPDTNVKIRA
jgi:4'-phosphopantetheinyl transferase